MRILIIHPENTYFAGAERMLKYFLDELSAKSGHDITVATAPGGRVAGLLPTNVRSVWIPDNQPFSLGRLWTQAAELRKFHQLSPFDIIQGWAARDWELAASTAWLCRRPAVGTLHDHPEASFISPMRRSLMRWSANHGLEKTICVSSAVRNACVKAGYSDHKLVVIHNGLPNHEAPSAEPSSETFRIGFLGAYSERKGVRDLFQIMDQIGDQGGKPLEWHLAGSTQDEAGERLLTELRNRYEMKSWWKNVHWHGWVESPQDFMGKIDLLIVPSSEFEPFGLVLVEAGLAGIPVLATRVGGIPEIVDDGQTGWLFEPGDVNGAVQLLTRKIIPQASLRQEAGNRAAQLMQEKFLVSKTVAVYLKVYSTLLPNG